MENDNSPAPFYFRSACTAAQEKELQQAAYMELRDQLTDTVAHTAHMLWVHFNEHASHQRARGGREHVLLFMQAIAYVQRRYIESRKRLIEQAEEIAALHQDKQDPTP